MRPGTPQPCSRPSPVRLGALGALLLGALLSACGPSAAGPTTQSSAAAAPAPVQAAAAGARQDGWASLVKAAEQEGRVVVFGPTGTTWRELLTAAFNKEYPQINVEFFGLGGTQGGPRIMAEQQAGIFSADIYVGGTSTLHAFLLPIGALDPIRPAFVLPDTLDPSKLYQGRYWFGDVAETYHLLFGMNPGKSLYHNTSVVDPREIQSYRDLLNPKWQGKIVTWDPRRPGPGSGGLLQWYHHPDLGSPFIREFYTKTDIALSTDNRQIVDWMAQGRRPVGIFISGTEVETGRGQGLPIDKFPHLPKEGTTMTPGFGGLGLLTKAPHPNAAKVYINWLLSRSGQTALQDIVGDNSLRLDVPKEKLAAKDGTLQPGVNYFYADDPKYLQDDKVNEEIRRLLNEVLADR
jgi:iron(III) transport system substrate-binding protein